MDDTNAAPVGKKCDDCLNRPAVLDYRGDTILYHLCLECAAYRVEFLRRRMAYLTKAIRQIKKTIPEAWQEFMRSKQTS